MALAAARHTALSSTAEAPVAPTPQRHRHGTIEQLDRPIADVHGVISRPYRAVDTLAMMERRGSITASMRQVGQDFRTQFATAQLDPLRAVDWSLPRQGSAVRNRGGGGGSRIEKAREFVWQTICIVGGLGSPGGSCLWYVVGWERSLKEWAIEQGWNGRRVSQESASGILVAALGTLEAHCRNSAVLRKSDF